MHARTVVLVGHGAPANDCPADLVARWKRLEAERRRSQPSPSEPGEEERALDRRIREWPRTDDNDPYRAGLESLGARLAAALGEPVRVAYNEFCAPSLEEVVRASVAAGARVITVVPTMLTPGGVHSEIEIPEALASLRAAHPEVTIGYAWPFDEASLAAVLAAHVKRFG
jgi:sirohydrochlorin cobaltochelatase